MANVLSKMLAEAAYSAYRKRAVEVATAETAPMLPEDFNVFMPELQQAWVDAAVAALECWDKRIEVEPCLE